MWNDVEAKIDLLNFSHVAKAAAQLIQDAGGEPLTIGVSGNWGAGKSSLVKMIGAELKASAGDEKYIFLEFNAWLYQGYDDARQALLDAVADKLVAVAESRKTAVDKAWRFVKRIKRLRVGLGGGVKGWTGARALWVLKARMGSSLSALIDNQDDCRAPPTRVRKLHGLAPTHRPSDQRPGTPSPAPGSAAFAVDPFAFRIPR